MKVIILDFDGVILESNAVKTQAFADVFARFPEHAEAMMAYHHANVSVSRFAKFDHLIRERLGRPEDTALRDELATEFSRRTQERIAAVPFVAGAPEFLRTFSARVSLYLASVTPAEDLGQTLERRDLRRFFRGVYGCPPWTKPGAVRDALAREHCAPADAVLVGDSNGDRRAAEETGIEFIARDSGLPFDPPAPTTFADMHAVGAALLSRIS